MGPGGTCQVEDEIYLVSPRGIPIVVGDVFEPAEVSLCSEVEQHVDPAVLAHRQLHELRAIGGITEKARLQRHHLAARSANHVDGAFSRLD